MSSRASGKSTNAFPRDGTGGIAADTDRWLVRIVVVRYNDPYEMSQR
mgnify:CR=1 FL=1